MPDTKVWTPWKEEELKMDSEISNRFDRLDDQHGKIFDLLRDTNDRLNSHLISDGQKKENHSQRIQKIEGQLEGSSALKSGTMMAAIGGGVAAIVSFLGKKTGPW